MISHAVNAEHEKSPIDIDLNNRNDTSDEDEELHLGAVIHFSGELNDLINDNEENTFGISMYEDLIDINSMEMKNEKSTQKRVESEITLKSKIDIYLVKYKVGSDFLPNTSIIYQEEEVSFGFSSDIIGKGTLFMESIEVSGCTSLTWNGDLLDCFGDDLQELGCKSKYSFPIKYIIDINLKEIDEEFFIFVKSDFQLKNETIFLQFSFNSQERAFFWFEQIKIQKRLLNKGDAYQNNVEYMSKFNMESNVFQSCSIDKVKRVKSDSLANRDTQMLSIPGNSYIPKISIPFHRERKNQGKTLGSSNPPRKHQPRNHFPLIDQNEKVYIENIIRDLVFSNVNHTFSHLGIESSKPIIQQRCSYIEYIINSILPDLGNNTRQCFISRTSSSHEEASPPSEFKENFPRNIQDDSFTCPICCENFSFNEITTLHPCEHKLCCYCEYKLTDSKCPWDRLSYTIMNNQ
ncbi:RING domain-containing protein [Cryptosporidium felis]|nr:RING domain-containing protein [Cryptosporidium felis]